MDWGETKSIMLEVEQLFNRGDDLRDVNGVRKMQGEIELHRINSLKDAKSLIKGFLIYFISLSFTDRLQYVITIGYVDLTNHVASKESLIMAPSEVCLLFFIIY